MLEEKGEKLLLNKLLKNNENFLDAVIFEKSIENGDYLLYISPSQTLTQYENQLWLNIQRDVIFNLAQECYVVVYLDKRITKTILFEELDKDIGQVYPFITNHNGNFLIKIPINDTHLLEEIIHTDLIWECGNLLNIAIFSEEPSLSANMLLLDKAKLVLYSFEDNLGFNIRINNKNEDELIVFKTVKLVLGNYNIDKGEF